MAADATNQVVGVDVGGTFTDLILIDQTSREVRLAKVPSTLDNQAFGVLHALKDVDAELAAINLIIHGTTTTTNAVLERKLSKTGLITTRGFRDVLELGRRTRPQAYGMKGEFTPIISRDLRIEVTERMDAAGRVVTPLEEEEVARAARKLLDADCESVVIHFLHTYANAGHEIRAAEIVRDIWPNDYVTMGHSLLSESREFERGVTAAVNASVQPLLERYVKRLTDELSRGGYDGEVLVMNGNGGGSTVLIEAGQNERFLAPAWSPDGKKIAYVRTDSNLPPQTDTQVWLYTIDGSQPPKSLTPNPRGDVRSPVWHPDGLLVGYIEQVNGFREMVTVGVDGSDPGTFIIPGGTAIVDELQFDWSPDGTRIALSAFDAFTAENGVYEISATAGLAPQQRLSRGRDVSWSPEGTQLIFSGPPRGVLQPFIYITAENDLTRAIETPMVGYQAAWQSVSANNPNPLAPETTLAVDARDASKKLKIGKKYQLVPEALTNGEITNVKLVCKARGSKVTGKKAKKTCAAKEKKKKEPAMTKVVAKPKCGSKVRIKAVITAQYQQADPLTWKRTWKVKKKSGPSCPK